MAEKESVLSDAQIERIIEDVANNRGDYVAGVEALAAMYRGERDRLEDEEPTPTAPKPGDRCRMIGGYRVEHWDCAEYPNGTITSIA